MEETELLLILNAILGKVDDLDYVVDIKRVDSESLSFKYKSGKSSLIRISDFVKHGVDGKEGAQGPKGKDGINGKDGKDGSNGKDGKNGVNGKDGRDGNNGENGSNGKNGIDGVDGIDGEDGKDGTNGRDGQDGKDGKDGEDGKDGAEGKRGNGIKDIRINQAGKLIISTDDKVYDLGVIKKFTGGGGGFEEFRYTNSLPMPNDVGGIPAGTTFERVKLKDLWTKLLYAYDDPVFSLFDIPSLPVEMEVGQVIPPGLYESVWQIDNTEMLKEDSIKIDYVNGVLNLANNLPNTGSYDLVLPEITFDTPVVIKFKIEAMNTMEEILFKDKDIKVKHRIYLGESFSSVLINSDSVKDLRFTSLADNINGEYEMLGGGYKWFCYPSSWGDRNHFYDVNTGLSIPMAAPILVNVTNDFGLDVMYKAYRTFNTLGGNIEIGIK